MVNPVSVNPIGTGGLDNQPSKGLGAPDAAGSASFRDLLEKSLGEINSLQHVAEEKISKLLLRLLHVQNVQIHERKLLICLDLIRSFYQQNAMCLSGES